jgi:APA family basic amino acid/polyamine antiporter
MDWNQLFAKKSLELLNEEAKGENRLRRVLGPISLTSLGIGAIIGAGIFVMTGRVAAQDAGPAIVLSFCVAGIGCLFAALCYSEFASMAPVAGSAYTYAYATLGEALAWVIGWDLVLEYAMACACVAASWSKYFNVFLDTFFGFKIPWWLCNDPFSTPGAWCNVPAFGITLLCTIILVIGIRESATTNAVLVAVKVGVVLFVIGVGLVYVQPANWTTVPTTDRVQPEEVEIPASAAAEVEATLKLHGDEAHERAEQISHQALAQYRLERRRQVTEELFKEGKIDAAERDAREKEALEKYGSLLPKTPQEKEMVARIVEKARAEAPKKATSKWGLLGEIGLNARLEAIDNKVRSPFMPYGFAGIIFGASIVFFAYIGFDAISTHAEEAKRPQRDVPIGILASLVICTVLYIAVSAVITGMLPYPEIDSEAALASAFSAKAKQGGSNLLNAAAGLIATGALAGMTSVLLITFLSQARIFLAISRDGLLPPSIFAAVHERFRTPHISTMLTGGIISVVAAVTPIRDLEEMVNIGTLMAFVIVCAAVLLLRIRRPDAERPFRAPAIYLVAPLGIIVNLIMMLFLPVPTWLRLVVWLAVGLCIYFAYGMSHSTLGRESRGLAPLKGTAADSIRHKPDIEPAIAPLDPPHPGFKQ